jgi:hypothetical protein
MAIEAQLADGRILEFPDGTDPSVIQATVKRIVAQSSGPKESTIGSELVRGGKQLVSSARTGIGSIFDPVGAAKAGVARSEDIGREAGEGVSLEAVKKAYRDKGLLSAAGETVSQIPRALASQGANLASMYAGAKAGSAAGSAFGVPGRAIGAGLGAGAVLLPQFMGSNVERQAEEQMEAGKDVDINRTKAYTTALGQAALEGAGTAFTLGKRVVGGILGLTDDVALKSVAAQAELVKAAERSLAASAGRGVVRGAAEMPVEVAQQILERYQAGLELTSPEAYKEYGESAYQAALIGGPIGGVAGAAERGQARGQLDQQRRAEEAAKPREPKEEVVPGAKLPEEAPVGKQGTLFTPQEMGKRVPEPKQETAFAAETFPELTARRDQLRAQEQTPEVRAELDAIAKRLAPQSDAQQGLGLDFERDYIDLFKERDRLREGPQTPEVKARIAELSEQLMSYDEADIGRRQAEKIIREERIAKEAEQKAADEAGAQRFPGLAGATTAPITQADIDAIGLPLKTSAKWIQDNVLGKTVEEIKALVQRDPKLISGTGARAGVLKALISPQPAVFEEKKNVPTPTQTDQPQGELDLGGGEPSVGVSGKPTGTNVVQPGTGVPATTGTSATPDGLGLAPAGQPAGTGTTSQGTQPPAVTTPIQDLEAARNTASNNAEDAFRAYTTAEQNLKIAKTTKGTSIAQLKKLATAVNKARRDYSVAQKKAEDAFEALKKAKEASATTTTPTATGTPATTTTTKGSKKATGAATKTTTTKTTKAPTATGTAEAVETDKQRKAREDAERKAKEDAERKAKEEAEAKAEADRKAKVEAEEEAERKREADEFAKQMEEVERKEKEARAKADAAKNAAAIAAKPVHPKWANSAAIKYKGVVVHSQGDIALVKYVDPDGKIAYGAVRDTSPYVTSDVSAMDPITTRRFSSQEIAALQKVKREDVKREEDLAKKYPDGPFTNAKSNVVAGDNINPRYVAYLKDLMDSLGLKDINTFFFTGKDVENFPEKFHLHGRYTRPYEMLAVGNETKGATTRMGPNNKDFFLYIRDDMDPDLTIEIIAHELGHMIQHIAFDTASAKERQAVMDEYDAWLASNKGKSMRELVPNLRNRRGTEMMEKSGIPDITTDQLKAKQQQYWLGFSEWFADNVSRWATTADKPLTIAEKFFSRVAQMMRDLVAVVSGRKFPPSRAVANFLEDMGPGSADAWIQSRTPGGAPSVTPFEAVDENPKVQFAVTFSSEQLIDSMGPLSRDDRSFLTKAIDIIKSDPTIDYVTKFRTQVADIAATIEKRLSSKFDGAVRNSLGELNPMGLYRQAQDYTKMLLEYFQTGTLYKDKATGLWKSGIGEGVRPPAEVYALIDKYAEKNGYSRERATQIASRVLEGVRLNEMRRSNNTGMTNFAIHLKDNEIDQLVKEFNADPDIQEMSKLMDEARIAMVDNMVKVGRLSAEDGKLWREVAGYVPFDRETIDSIADNFNKAKKISGKGLAQLGKLPELVGSIERPVGNVFDNYLNTLGWMVGQTLKSDANLTTLRSLEDAGFAKKLRTGLKPTAKSVGAYVNGEMQYWELPSKYDVMAFKDLNPPKAGWLRLLGAFSNILRKAVTALPPFALKQVADDVQRAIMTSGVKNPGALVWMSLTNFPKLALAELRGIQHPMVKDFGKLGLTGEYDFEAGKPAASLLKDLGYKKRGRFESILHKLDGITRASDLAVRKAIYDQTLKESGDALLAQTRAREFINFRRRGANDFVGAMVTTIPFFNAYIQGMDVLYRAASGKDSSSSVDRAQARQLFWSRAAIVTTFSMMYALGKDDDDEDYNNMDLRTRDSNWIFPGGYKLGVPGELGAIFKVIPERIVEYMKRQGTPEEQTAFEAVRTTLGYMFEQYLGRATPVPQAIKPVLEAWANKSFLTGKDLEGYHHRAMDPSMRMTDQTSELAKAIAKFSRDEIGVEVSPIMVDNALRGYLGSTAAMFTMVTDSLLNPTRVDRPLHKYALFSNYLYDPVGTRRMTEFYEEREKVGKANTTLNELMKTDIARAEKYVDEHADELQLESAVNSTLEQLERTRAYRKFLNSPDGAEEMSKEDREAELKEIKKVELELVSWVREAKAELRKVQR